MMVAELRFGALIGSYNSRCLSSLTGIYPTWVGEFLVDVQDFGLKVGEIISNCMIYQLSRPPFGGHNFYLCNL